MDCSFIKKPITYVTETISFGLEKISSAINSFWTSIFTSWNTAYSTLSSYLLKGRVSSIQPTPPQPSNTITSSRNEPDIQAQPPLTSNSNEAILETELSLSAISVRSGHSISSESSHSNLSRKAEMISSTVSTIFVRRRDSNTRPSSSYSISQSTNESYSAKGFRGEINGHFLKELQLENGLRFQISPACFNAFKQWKLPGFISVSRSKDPEFPYALSLSGDSHIIHAKKDRNYHFTNPLANTKKVMV